MRNLGSNIDLRKVDFLSQQEISDRSHVLTNVNNGDIYDLFLTSKQVLIELTLRDVFVYKARAFTYFFRT